MFDSDDSDVDVCTVDDESTSSFVGLTVVAAETYIEQENNNQTGALVPLSSEDLLTREKELKLKEAKLKKHSTGKESVPSTVNIDVKKVVVIDEGSGVISNSEDAQDVLNLKETNSEQKEIIESGDKKDSVINSTVQEAPFQVPHKSSKRKHTDTEKENDSEEELFDTGVENVLRKFSFESDHLAIKNNKDYHKLLQTLAVLEAQRTQAIKDFEELNRLKEVALADPLDFVKKIQEKKGHEIPKRQQVAKLPEINWVHYMTAYTSDKYVQQITTRNAIKEFEQETLEGANDYESIESKMMKETGEKALKSLDRHSTFNQKWSVEEQEKLEQLLVLYPPEEVEARRWEKIARALGTRTPQQVSSRIQKYFIKLAKAKLPIPGRAPSSTLLTAVKKKPNPISFKNSTFFPSWRPTVSMKEDDDHDSYEDDIQYKICDVDISDDEDIPENLKETPEYKELMELKKIKKFQSLQSQTQTSNRPVIHGGFMCDGCSMDPIVGVRWHCLDCPVNNSVDFCNNCIEKPVSHSSHSSEHELAPIHQNIHNNGDDDYTTFEQRKFKYNYLDPNFLPS